MPATKQADAREALGNAREWCAPHFDAAGFEMNTEHRVYFKGCSTLKNMSSSVQAELVCFEASCRARFAITEVLYDCPQCGGLLEVRYSGVRPSAADAARSVPTSAA